MVAFLDNPLREVNPEIKISLPEHGLKGDTVLSLIADYDLVIDTGSVPLDDAVDMIVAASVAKRED